LTSRLARERALHASYIGHLQLLLGWLVSVYILESGDLHFTSTEISSFSSSVSMQCTQSAILIYQLRPSVCPIPVLCVNEWPYHFSF